MNMKAWRYIFCVCDPGAQTSHKGQFMEIEIYTSSEAE